MGHSISLSAPRGSLKGSQGEATSILTRGAWAYEKNGRLYGLHENLSHFDKTRKLLSWNKGEPLLAGLQPQMTGVCSDYFSWLRLKASGLNAFLRPESDGDQKRRADSQVTLWKKRELSLPGRSTPTKEFSLPPEGSAAGAGGDGPPLLVCLGNDPSATLAAIYAQRPERVWIFYDRKTPFVANLAGNLAACAQQLPVGEVTFLATDVSGGGIVTHARRVCSAPAGPLVANVSPGSKAQSWVFGQMEGVRLVSIDKRRGGVSSLDGVEPALFFDLAPVASEVLGKTLGGPGLRARLGMAEIAAREEFLREMAHCLKTLAKSDKPLSFDRNPLTLVTAKERTELKSSWTEDVLRVRISRQGKSVAGEFSAPLENGSVKAD